MAYTSVIGSSAVIRGNVRGEGSLEILGRVEGDVGVSGDLSLGPDAVVVGAVSGARVSVSGSVEGDVTGSDAVVVTETGRVIGDLVAPLIGMAEGAEVRGSVRTDVASARTNGRLSSRAVDGRGAAAGSELRASRAAVPAPVAAAASAGTMSVSAASNSPGPKPMVAAKKPPPPPIIQAPRPGARARKKLARR